jgi:hypothetical protein
MLVIVVSLRLLGIKVVGINLGRVGVEVVEGVRRFIRKFGEMLKTVIQVSGVISFSINQRGRKTPSGTKNGAIIKSAQIVVTGLRVRVSDRRAKAPRGTTT